MAQTKLHDIEADANKAVGRDSEALSAQIDAIRADVSKLTELMGEIGSRRKDETVEAARQRLARLRSKGEARYDEAQRYASDSADQAIEAVRRQPLTAVGIAVGVGFLFGMISRSR